MQPLSMQASSRIRQVAVEHVASIAADAIVIRVAAIMVESVSASHNVSSANIADPVADLR
jgi:hypothetical protein